MEETHNYFSLNSQDIFNIVETSSGSFFIALELHEILLGHESCREKDIGCIKEWGK